MTKTERLEELQYKVEHLQDRVDHLRDYMHEIEPSSKMNYFWSKFETLVEMSHKYDVNTDEYSRLNKIAWEMLDRYLQALLESPFGRKNDED